jgi:hypothetical protein
LPYHAPVNQSSLLNAWLGAFMIILNSSRR